MKFSWNRILFWLCVVALAGVVGMAFVPQPVAVDVTTVARGGMRVSVQEEGRTRIRDRYTISAPIAGRLSRIPLREGDPVTAGETRLATVEPGEPPLLDARRVAEAEAHIEACGAAVELASAETERATVAADLAAAELERARPLRDSQAFSQQELDRLESAARAAAAALRSARHAVDVRRFEWDMAKAALARGRMTPQDGAMRGGRLEIFAPVSGVVLHVFEESEAQAQPGMRLIEIGDPADLEIEVEVLSQDAVSISPGCQARIVNWGGAAELAARVRRVEPAAFTKVSALGVEEQRVNVILDLAEPREAWKALGDGYRVDVDIILWEGDGILTVPAGSLFRAGDSWQVFAVVGGRAALTPVRVGRMNARQAEILGGLKQGETIIQYPSDRIRDGIRVEARAAR